MSSTVAGTRNRSRNRQISIGIPAGHTTVTGARSSEYSRTVSLAAAIVAPQGNAISVLLRTLLTRRTLRMSVLVAND